MTKYIVKKPLNHNLKEYAIGSNVELTDEAAKPLLAKMVVEAIPDPVEPDPVMPEPLVPEPLVPEPVTIVEPPAAETVANVTDETDSLPPKKIKKK